MRISLQLIKTLAFAALMFISLGKVNASHFMGGDITYVCIGPNQYSIVAKLFRDCNGITLDNTISVNIASANCGYNQNVTLSNLNGATNSYIAPLCDLSQDACVNTNGTYGVEQYFYRGIVTLPNCLSGSDFVLSWTTCCRNSAITTLSNAGSNWLYANLNNTLAQCNSSPAFNFEPSVYLCLGQENHFNNGVTDIDGDRLQFSLTNCLETATASVSYNPGFSGTAPLTTSFISIDAQTGQIDITPTALEVGVICIKVEEFRSNVKISETIRDLQFTVLNCGANTLPILSGFNGTASAVGSTGSYGYTGCVGEDIEFDIVSYDAQGIPLIGTQFIEMEWGIGIPTANFIIDDTTSSLPTAKFHWKPTAADIGVNFFTVKIKDDACLLNGISMFTYKINVQASGLNFNITNPNLDTICINDTLLINAATTNFGGGIVYNWTTNASTDVLSCTTCQDPYFTPTLPGLYTFACTMKNLGASTNCVAGDSIQILVVGESSDTTMSCYVSTRRIDQLVEGVAIAPNPLTTNATLSYNLKQRSDVIIEIYSMLGQKVSTIANEKQAAGQYQLQIGDAINEVKGIYFVRMSVDGEMITKKVLVQ